MKWRLPIGSLARTSLQVMVWQGVRLVCLAAWIVVAARGLGAQHYGIFSGIAGTASALAGLVGLGSGMLMYQYSASDPSRFSPYWKQTLVLCALTSLPLAALLFPSVLGSASISLSGITLIAASEILAYPYVTNAAFAFAAHERMGWAAALPAASALLRLIAIVAFSLLPIQRDLDHYLLLHLLASLGGAAFALVAVNRLLAPQPQRWQMQPGDLRHGAAHAASWTSTTAVTTLDKSLVLRAGGDTITGLYAACYRIAAVAAMPLDAMVMSSMPRLFRANQEQERHRRLVLAMAAAAAAYTGIIAALLWWGAAVLPRLLGPDFAPAVPALRWMGLFVLGYSLRQIGCNVLVGRGLKLRKTLIEAIGLLTMALLSAWLIPRHGLTGAVWMVICAEIGMASAAWVTLWLSVGKKAARALPSQ
ncbi:lipopolysaccharide biosynthesis protein [Stenotrophomonas rhizophila]|uniref:lipopolysaccharide biosynthesis protein n=1 Tax=Stenotrophomonas rhizophila TaxID=216778 RepID=UPI001E6321B0|nr:oligosaccharide flippase family protein [Stenotrophomonas rhizophila]MCC7635774.1 oligosaccharide flippase family protein [Stenotrophomonas rhizophila]MCC7665041.1 oligosaccharide flippase family protein [Stenotrophomonas rhizophila]